MLEINLYLVLLLPFDHELISTEKFVWTGVTIGN